MCTKREVIGGTKREVGWSDVHTPYQALNGAKVHAHTRGKNTRIVRKGEILVIPCKLKSNIFLVKTKSGHCLSNHVEDALELFCFLLANAGLRPSIHVHRAVDVNAHM